MRNIKTADWILHLSELLRHSFFKNHFGERKASVWSPVNHCVPCSELPVDQICFPQDGLHKAAFRTQRTAQERRNQGWAAPVTPVQPHTGPSEQQLLHSARISDRISDPAPATSPCAHPTALSNVLDSWYCTWTSELEIHSWVLAAPGPPCIPPFEKQKGGNVPGLELARSWAWEGRRAGRDKTGTGMGRDRDGDRDRSAWAPWAAAQLKSVSRHIPSLLLFKASDDCLKSSTKSIFNFLSFPNSKGKEICSISELEGRNCCRRKFFRSPKAQVPMNSSYWKLNRWPNTWDAGLPLYPWP